MKKYLVAILGLAISGVAVAKLPAPTEEAKAKAEEAKAKSAWSDKVAAYKLCLSQDAVAAYYLKTKGKDSKPMPAPACADPGPYVSASAANSPAIVPAPAVPNK